MNSEHIKAFSQIPQPPRESFGFIEDIKSPLEYHFRPGQGCDAGVNADCMKNGAEIVIEYPALDDFPETAFMSLRRVLKAKNITEKNGKLVSLRTVYENEDLIIITDSGMTIRMEISQISTLSRNTQGVRLINLKENQKVSTTAIIEKDDEEEKVEDTTEEVLEEVKDNNE